MVFQGFPVLLTYFVQVGEVLVEFHGEVPFAYLTGDVEAPEEEFLGKLDTVLLHVEDSHVETAQGNPPPVVGGGVLVVRNHEVPQCPCILVLAKQ